MRDDKKKAARGEGFGGWVRSLSFSDFRPKKKRTSSSGFGLAMAFVVGD